MAARPGRRANLCKNGLGRRDNATIQCGRTMRVQFFWCGDAIETSMFYAVLAPKCTRKKTFVEFIHQMDTALQSGQRGLFEGWRTSAVRAR